MSEACTEQRAKLRQARMIGANGAVVTASTKSIVVKSKPVNNSKVSATSVKVNKSITITGAATGGSGSYTYAYYYKKSTDSKYTTIKGYSTTKSLTYKFGTAGTYNVKVAVKDSNGVTVNKVMTVTVKK